MSVGWIDTPERWRDVFIMAYMVAGIILMVLGIVFTIIIGTMLIALLKKAQSLMNENLRPAIENARHTSENVRGTVGFVSENAVTPVLKAYGFYAGTSRFLRVFLRLTRRRRKVGGA